MAPGARPAGASNKNDLAVIGIASAILVACVATLWPWTGTLWAIIHSNPILQAIFVPSGIGALLYVLRMAALQIYAKIAGKLYSTITVENKDENWHVILDYISKQGPIEATGFVATTFKNKNRTWRDWRKEYTLGVRDAPKMDFRCVSRACGHCLACARGVGVVACLVAGLFLAKSELLLCVMRVCVVVCGVSLVRWRSARQTITASHMCSSSRARECSWCVAACGV